VPFARDLHPEFGYIGSAPKLFRKLGLASAFVVFGAVAGVIGVTVFMTDPDPNPMHAMALAPTEPLISASGTPPAPANTNRTASEQEIINAGPTRSPCSDDISERLDSDCASRVHKPRPVQAVNERPSIAAVAIGHREEPAILPSEPTIPVAAIPEPPDNSSGPADPANVAPTTQSVVPVAKHSQTRSRHVARREGHSYSGRSSYSPRYYSNRQVHQAGGYAGLW
jgi:hypothetical protein